MMWRETSHKLRDAGSEHCGPPTTASAHCLVNGRRVRILAGLALLILLSGFQAVQAQIAVDNTSVGVGPGSNVNSLTWSHTVGSGSNRVLIVGVSLRDANVSVSNITYGGTGLTFIGSSNEAGLDVRIEMWRLIAPATGTANIVVTLSAAKRIVGGATSFTGVNQTTPNGAFNSAQGNSTPTPVVTVSSVSGAVVIDTVAAMANTNSLIVNAGQDLRWSGSTSNGNNDVRGGGSTKPGAATVTMSWTLSSAKPWAIGAISLNPIIPEIALAKSVSPSGTQSPGTDLAYVVNFTNSGLSPASSFIMLDPIPTYTDFKVGSVTTSLDTTGLTVTVAYSNNGGTTWTYTPASGAGGAPSGYDRIVTDVRWSFSGNLSQTAPNNTGSVGLTVRIR